MSKCILWPEDHVNPNGYGWLMFEGKVVYAHRFILGFPDGDVGHICHDKAAALGLCAGGNECLHRRCVNPSHLATQTRSENLSSSPHTMVHRKNQTHCSKGHEFTEENTLWEYRGNGYTCRKCRTCKNERQRKKYHQRTNP